MVSFKSVFQNLSDKEHHISEIIFIIFKTKKLLPQIKFHISTLFLPFLHWLPKYFADVSYCIV